MDMYGPFFEERRLNYSNMKGLERFHRCSYPGHYLPWPDHFYNNIEPQYPWFLTAFGKMYPWPEVSPIWGKDRDVFYERPYGNQMPCNVNYNYLPPGPMINWGLDEGEYGWGCSNIRNNI